MNFNKICLTVLSLAILFIAACASPLVYNPKSGTYQQISNNQTCTYSCTEAVEECTTSCDENHLCTTTCTQEETCSTTCERTYLDEEELAADEQPAVKEQPAKTVEKEQPVEKQAKAEKPTKAEKQAKVDKQTNTEKQAKTEKPAQTEKPAKAVVEKDIIPDDVTNDALEDLVGTWLGTRYLTAGVDHNGVDCSGYAMRIYQDFYNIELPHNAAMIFKDSRGKAKRRDQLQEGDLVFFGNGGNNISHIGIYLDGNRFTHASSSHGVIISSMDDKYWAPKYKGARSFVK